jgi:acyl dehydratase
METAREFEPMVEEVTQEKIDLYAELSGDFNPLHVDLEAAAASEFGGTIAHGPISLQPCFRSLAAWLGEEALPAGTKVSVTYRYRVRPGDRVSFEGAFDEKQSESVRLEGQCVNQDGTAVASIDITLPDPGRRSRGA